MSPLLYNVYADDMSDLSSWENDGCNVAHWCVNNLSYVDAMVSVAPTLSALQNLLGISNNFARSYDVVSST